VPVGVGMKVDVKGSPESEASLFSPVISH